MSGHDPKFTTMKNYDTQKYVCYVNCECGAFMTGKSEFKRSKAKESGASVHRDHVKRMK